MAARYTSVPAVLAAVSMETAVVLSIFLEKPITSYVVRDAPIALREIVMAVWLLVRGFSSTAPLLWGPTRTNRK